MLSDENAGHYSHVWVWPLPQKRLIIKRAFSCTNASWWYRNFFFHEFQYEISDLTFLCDFIILHSHLTDGGEYECSDDHEDGLHEVCPDDGRETSGDGEEAGDAQQDQDGDVDGVLTLDLKSKFVQTVMWITYVLRPPVVLGTYILL